MVAPAGGAVVAAPAALEIESEAPTRTPAQRAMDVANFMSFVMVVLLSFVASTAPALLEIYSNISPFFDFVKSSIRIKNLTRSINNYAIAANQDWGKVDHSSIWQPMVTSVARESRNSM